jgi:DNA-binding transcriptional MerR regulator
MTRTTAGEGAALTIDELAGSTGTTTRRIRSFQTLGLLPGPTLRGRTGYYGPDHEDRVAAVLRLQSQGFSLDSLAVLFRALDAGATLADVLGVRERPRGAHAVTSDADPHDAELYGFAQLERDGWARPGRRPMLALVPTTMWGESAAS